MTLHTSALTFSGDQEARLKAIIRAEIQARCKPREFLTVSEWADGTPERVGRVLSGESCAEPGRWKTSRMAPLRGIMDAVSDADTHTVVVEKGAQLGWTECLCNVTGYFIDHEPSSMLVIQPVQKNAETWSKKRLTPMLRDTPSLRGKVRDAKSRDSDNTILEKSYPGGTLAIVGASTPNDLASRPLRVVLADEVDKYVKNVAGFGDPLALARSRQNNFWNRKTLIGSTPGEKRTSTVHHWFMRGDQRYFQVPCPHCGHAQVLRWAQVDWTKDHLEDGRTVHHTETAVYLCEAPDCGTAWTDAERWRAIATAEANGGGWVPTAPFSGIASFHLPGLLSSWARLSEMANQFVEAKGYMPRLRTWVNEVLGEPWEDRGEAADPTKLENRLEAYDESSLPDWARLVTAGVDTQDDRLEATFTAWGDGEESWVVSHEVLLGDPGKLEVWTELDQLLKDAQFTTESGRRMRVKAACVDSGGHHGNMVLGFARTRASRRIYATKGQGNDPRGSKPIWTKTLLNTRNSGDRLWGVGVDTAKDDLAARLRIVPGDGPTPRAVHFPVSGLPVGYFGQLTAEQVVTELNEAGRKVRKWKMKPGVERNEALDCFILSHAAMLSTGIKLMPRPARHGVPAEPVEPEPEVAEEPTVPEPIDLGIQKPVRRQRPRWRAYGGGI